MSAPPEPEGQDTPQAALERLYRSAVTTTCAGYVIADIGRWRQAVEMQETLGLAEPAAVAELLQLRCAWEVGQRPGMSAWFHADELLEALLGEGDVWRLRADIADQALAHLPQHYAAPRRLLRPPIAACRRYAGGEITAAERRDIADRANRAVCVVVSDMVGGPESYAHNAMLAMSSAFMSVISAANGTLRAAADAAASVVNESWVSCTTTWTEDALGRAYRWQIEQMMSYYRGEGRIPLETTRWEGPRQ